MTTQTDLTPSDPRLDGFRVWSRAHNPTESPTTFWLVRRETSETTAHRVVEVMLMPGETGRLDWPSRGTGRFVYQAVQFDPNMAANRYSAVVEIVS